MTRKWIASLMCLAFLLGSAIAFMPTLPQSVARPEAQWVGNIGSTTAACTGGTASLAGGNSVGSVLIGAGVVTTCTVTFSHTLSFTPRCLISTSLSTVLPGVVESTSSLVLTFSVSLGSQRFNYLCFNPAQVF